MMKRILPFLALVFCLAAAPSGSVYYGDFPSCADSGGNHLNYNSSTGTFSCGTSSSGGVPSGSAGGGLTGTYPNPSLANPSPSTLGGIESYVAVTNQFLDSISTGGVPHSSQPTFANLSGSATCAQMPALTGDVTSSAGSCATTAASVTSALHINFSSTTTVTAQTMRFIIPWTSGHITKVLYYTGGTGTPSFVADVKLNGTDVTGCNAITVSAASVNSTTCTSTAVAASDLVTIVISSPSGTPDDSVVDVYVTHTVN